MKILVAVFDLCAFVVSLIMVGSILVRYKKVDTLFLLLGVTIVLNCMGRFWITISQTVDTAILANKLMYVGGCYITPLLIMVLFRLCNLKLPRFVSVIMMSVSTIILALVMTIGYNDLYYKEVKLVVEDGCSRLDKVYGPLHILYPITMVLYGVFLVLFAVWAIRMRNKLPLSTAIGAVLMGVGIIGAYVLEKLLDSEISLMSVGYFVVMIFIIRYFDRLNMYDMSANIISSVEQRREYGYIVFDNKLRYISSDEYLKEIFPEIREWAVDKCVACCPDSLLCAEVIQGIADMKRSSFEKKVLCVGDKYFELDAQPVCHGKKQVGYLVEFVDRTLEHKYYNSIENYNAQLEKEVAEQTADILHIKDMMVLGMADMVESRDNNTGGHIKRTSAVVKVFAERLKQHGKTLGLTDDFLRMVEKAAPMHDLGKIAIDDKILRKPGKFTDEEYNEMKRHTTEGARIVESILRGVEDDDFVEIAKNVALYHHEKWNGKGYPMNISAADIPIEARVMALADVFDALVSKRCYKEAFSYDKAFSIIEEDLGQHFDPELGRVFLDCRKELEQIYDEYARSA